MASHPTLRSIVLDCLDVHELAEFYRALTGWDYPAGYDPADFDDWLSIIGPEGVRISFQKVPALKRTTWPADDVPQQAHLDFLAGSAQEMEEQHERLLALGAVVRADRSDDPEEPLRVYADPAGHTFCLFTQP
ncbi:MAG TPA: VOC family protein [Nocardioides sp.]|nr:VOC family protein [Nocardioides sp.]